MWLVPSPKAGAQLGPGLFGCGRVGSVWLFLGNNCHPCGPRRLLGYPPSYAGTAPALPWRDGRRAPVFQRKPSFSTIPVEAGGGNLHFLPRKILHVLEKADKKPAPKGDRPEFVEPYLLAGLTVPSPLSLIRVTETSKVRPPTLELERR